MEITAPAQAPKPTTSQTGSANGDSSNKKDESNEEPLNSTGITVLVICLIVVIGAFSVFLYIFHCKQDAKPVEPADMQMVDDPEYGKVEIQPEPVAVDLKSIGGIGATSEKTGFHSDRMEQAKKGDEEEQELPPAERIHKSEQ